MDTSLQNRPGSALRGLLVNRDLVVVRRFADLDASSYALIAQEAGSAHHIFASRIAQRRLVCPTRQPAELHTYRHAKGRAVTTLALLLFTPRFLETA